jgi:hypothetical protein
MAPNNANRLVKEAKLTPISDTKGHEVFICDPPWFDEREKFAIAHAPARTAALEFDGSDLNFMARVLYAEASGSFQLPNKDERDKEKSAILNVNHFRLNRREYPSQAYIAKSFKEVCRAPNQFESVFKKKPKFILTERTTVNKIGKNECEDLREALEAIKIFLADGPNANFQYDNFRGYATGGEGTLVGRSRFWLSGRGAELLAKTP